MDKRINNFFLDKEKKFIVEIIQKEDPEYKILKKVEKNYDKNKDKYVDFESINWF